jgi:SSS family solute:Na+ symporter
MAFMQNYFGLPLALIIVCAVFLPIYRKLGVYTAYEYLGKRFDAKTRLLGAGHFSFATRPAGGHHDLCAGHHPFDRAGLAARPDHHRHRAARDRLHRHRRQRGGEPHAKMADGRHLRRHDHRVCRAADETAADALHIAGAMGKLQAVDFTPDPTSATRFWSGMLGGLFLSLSYFGTDQSQVQRYIGGAALREGRLGLMFNALLKIPMQFFIVCSARCCLCSINSSHTPGFLQSAEWRRHVEGPQGATFKAIEEKYAVLHADQQAKIRAWLAARDHGNAAEPPPGTPWPTAEKAAQSRARRKPRRA